MSVSFDRLLDVLAAEAGTFERLVELAREERGHLISGDVPRLTGTVAAQRSLLDSLAELERRRGEALDEWTDRDPEGSSPPGPRPTLRRVAAMAPPGAAARLEAFRSRLVNAGEELRRLSRGNYFLALKSLDFVDSTIQLMAETLSVPESATYDRPGGARVPERAALLVDRTV